MPQRVTPKDLSFVGKELKAPEAFAGAPVNTILTVRRIVIFGADSRKLYLVRNERGRPEWDNDSDDEFDVTGNLEEKYVRQGLFFEPEQCKKLIAARTRELATGAEAEPVTTQLRREPAPATTAQPTRAPARAGARRQASAS